MAFGQVPQWVCLLPLSLEWESHLLTVGILWWFRVGWKFNIKVIGAGNLLLLQPSIYAIFPWGYWPLLGKLQHHRWGAKGWQEFYFSAESPRPTDISSTMPLSLLCCSRHVHRVWRLTEDLLYTKTAFFPLQGGPWVCSFLRGEFHLMWTLC